MTLPLAPLHICIRKTVDWADEAAFRAQLDPGFALKVQAWNNTFQLPYHEFRRELRAIAQANLEAVAGAVVCYWDDVPDGGLVAPVDDDDWFSPQLVKVIQAAASPDVVGLRWQQSVLEVPINAGHRLRLLMRCIVPGMKPRWLCATNSYLVRKGSVDPHCFSSHVAASRWFPQQHADRIRVLPQRLSLHNRTMASITSLNYGRPSITPWRLRLRARAYSRLYRRWQAIPPELAWALPSLQRMKALMNRLWGQTP
jgi:hypothetical protein